AGEMPRLDKVYIEPSGCAIEARIYAEDPARDFRPSAGRLTRVLWPEDGGLENTRLETWVERGSEITPYYDPMLAKIIVHGPNRDVALQRLRAALNACDYAGVENNLDYLRQVCAHPAFANGGINVGFLRGFPYWRNDVEVVSGGTQTTVQDFPGRL